MIVIGAERLGLEPGCLMSSQQVTSSISISLGQELNEERVPGRTDCPESILSFSYRLTKNELDDEVAESFAEMLKVNQTLKHLW